MSLNRIKRPWEIKRSNDSKSQGRKVVTNFYHSKEWRKIRESFLNGRSFHLPGLNNHINKFCWICALNSKYVKTHTIDHIKPINRVNPYDTEKGKYGLPLHHDNLAPLCMKHAARKNAMEKHGKILKLYEQAELLRDIDY